MIVKFDTKDFTKKLNNVVNYSTGFLDGAQSGKTVFLRNLGEGAVEALKQYIDANARMDPSSYHHIYEWYRSGSPEARLFDIDYTISNLGLSFKGKFTQSKSIEHGSSEPFYNKAEIMENGVPVRIAPKKSEVLAFEIDGETVFTRNSVTVNNPGGENVVGSFEKAFDFFFSKYFTQSFLRSSGVIKYLSNPVIYKKNLPAGARNGRGTGIKTGYTWITNATMGVVND